MTRFASFLVATLFLCRVADATSVGVGEHRCPICERELKTIDVMSYSQFGEPARDLSDLPKFTLFGTPKACPWDLYSAFPSDWEMTDPKELTAMKRFLDGKPLKIQLTDAESELLTGRPFPDSLRPLLWARTCNLQRKPDPERDRFTALLCFYATQDTTDPVLKQWHSLYRSQAIEILTSHGSDESYSEVERSGFTYLTGELLRQAGQFDESKKRFSKAQDLARKSPSADDEWVERWSQEQTLRMEIGTIDSTTLSSWIIRPLLNPWQESEKVDALAPEKWNKHEQALDTLLNRATTKNDTQAEEILWKLTGKDPVNLLALAETSSEHDIRELANQTARWKSWFHEICQAEKAGSSKSLTALLTKGRNRNILGRIAGFQRSSWQDDPSVKAAVLTACQSADPAMAAASLGKLDQREVLGELMDQLEEEDAERVANAARLATLLLKDLPEDPKLANWPVSYLLVDLCANRELTSKALEETLPGDWQSPFWKSCIAYAAGRDDARPKLLKSPLRTRRSKDDGLVFDHLLYQMFEETGDKALVPDGIKILSSDEWISSEVQSYLMSIDDKRIHPVLLKRLIWLNQPATKELEAYPMILESEALDIEEYFFTSKLQALGVK